MKQKEILVSQVVRFIVDVGEYGHRSLRSPVPLIDGLREKYGFVEVPQTVAELDFTKGVKFAQGYYKGRIINKLQIFNNGVLCEANEDTSLSDEFLGELLAWAEQEHSLPVKETGVKAYLSQLVVVSPVDIGAAFSKFSAIGVMLADALRNYGQQHREYRVSGIKMHYDSMIEPPPRAPEFTFERRAGELFSTKEFFTSAPVRTSDHLAILEALEKVFC
jgi:hypothetical protein